MTWNKLISLFPRATFIEHNMYALWYQFSDHVRDKLNQFAGNGWHLEDIVTCAMMEKVRNRGIFDLPNTGPTTHASMNSLRRVGDSHAYHVRLNTDGLRHETSHVPPTVLDYSEFEIHPRDRHRFVTDCQEIDHPLLRWRYTAIHHLIRPIYQSILKRLDRLLPFEILRLPLEQRPEGFFSEPDGNGNRQLHRSFLGREPVYDWSRFEKPASWQYLDHMIPVWYDLYLERHAKQKSDENAQTARREQDAERSI